MCNSGINISISRKDKLGKHADAVQGNVRLESTQSDLTCILAAIQQAIIMPLSVLLLAMMTLLPPTVDSMSCLDAAKQCETDDECLSRYFKTVGSCVKERKDKKCAENSECAKAAKKLQAHPKGKLYDGCKCPAKLQPKCGQVVSIFDKCIHYHEKKKSKKQ